MSDPDVAGLSAPYRVRFDECTPAGVARTSALLRYAQDVAWIHSERLGFGREWYAERDRWWLVRSAELAVLRPIPLGTTLTVSTAVTGFRRVWARRLTEARTADGTLASWAHTDWVMTGPGGVPTRVPPDFPARFEHPPGSFEPVKVDLPPTPGDAASVAFVVRPHELDPMGHVNNAAYLDYLEEAVIADGPRGAELVAAVPRHVRIEYLAAAGAGVRLVGSAWEPTGDGAATASVRRAYRLVDEAGRELVRATLEPHASGRAPLDVAG